ncbi:hypothetical protein WA538_002302 [Blastocystis sp. DL]
MDEKRKNQLISALRSRIDEVLLGSRNAPQSVFSKEQTSLLETINKSPLSVEEKNSLLRYLFFTSVRCIRCLESDLAKETKQKETLRAENEKLKERASKSSELISRLQELNQALTDELDVVKTKERTMIMEEKRLREQIIGKFMASLDDLNGKVEENSKANSTLLDENNSLREEFKQKIAQYQEQARISKEMIEKLTEVNTLYESQIDEMKGFVLSLNEKAREADAMKKTIGEYQELVSKQNAIIGTVKEHRDKLSHLVKQYEEMMKQKKEETKKKNVQIDALNQELSSLKKELKKATAKALQLESLCRYLQERKKELELDAVASINDEDDLL